MKQGDPVKKVAGRGVVVRGNDVDTDQIIPARYMKVVSFDGLGEFAFGDQREDMKSRGEVHPFDNPVHQGASILFGNKNFGCGSSREHAPQSLMRWGISCIIAESFAEIFAGNCTSLGIPTAVLSSDQIDEVMSTLEETPSAEVSLNLENKELTIGSRTYHVDMSETYRSALVLGKWDSTAILLEHIDEVEAKRNDLVYLRDFA